MYEALYLKASNAILSSDAFKYKPYNEKYPIIQYVITNDIQ